MTIFQEDAPIRTNFHSHTTRCQHANGSDEAYVQAAIEAGYVHLGMSDHGPWPYRDGFVSDIRMPLHEFEDYLASALALKTRYKANIELFIGLESEYYPEYMNWLIETKQRHSLDFLLLGSHFEEPREHVYFGGQIDAKQLFRYARHTIKGMESGVYACLAHPDLFMTNLMVFDKNCQDVSRDICRAAKALNMPLEYNISGLYPVSWRQGISYPCPQFWEIAAEEGTTALIGLDAHSPERYKDTDKYDQAKVDLTKMGIQVLDSLFPLQDARQLAM